MIPLVVMVVAWVAFRLLGAVGLLQAAGSSPGALRFALALMFVFTGAAHFFPRAASRAWRFGEPPKRQISGERRGKASPSFDQVS